MENNQSQNNRQFTVGPVQFHTHNGVDSPRIKSSDLQGEAGPTIIAGVVRLVSGTATITDDRITTDSVITATSQNSYTVLTFNGTIAAVCNNGNAVIFSSGGVSTDPVNYIIVVNPS